MKRFVLGLTGSIGMGKTTTAALFAAQGVAIWDADLSVHQLYAPNGAATKLIARIYPDVIENGSVSRPRLRAKIAVDATVLENLQKLVHPLVAASRSQYLLDHPEGIVVLDIPLLFETGTDSLCDGIAVVSTDADTQRNRVLSRGEMKEHELELLLARQMPDDEKRRRATWIIPTDSPDTAKKAVAEIVAEITKRLTNA